MWAKNKREKKPISWRVGVPQLQCILLGWKRLYYILWKPIHTMNVIAHSSGYLFLKIKLQQAVYLFLSSQLYLGYCCKFLVTVKVSISNNSDGDQEHSEYHLSATTLLHLQSSLLSLNMICFFGFSSVSFAPQTFSNYTKCRDRM